jgi:peptidyl-Lys metalloendopeptidase
MRIARFALVVAFVALTTVTVISDSPKGWLTPTLELEDPAGWVRGDESPMIRFTLENSGTETLRVLRWQTPVAGIDHDMFEVTRDGKPVAYTGQLIKRAAPQPADYIEIEAGDSLSVTFDPSAAYDMVRAGDYTVRYRTSFTDVRTANEKAAAVVISREETESNVVAFFYEGLPQASDALTTRGVDCSKKPCHPKCPPNPDLCGGDDPGGGDPGVEFVSCTSQQQGKALTAIGNATNLSAASASDLADGSSSLYERWFGAYKARYFNTVKDNFAAISDAFETQTITINCTDADLGYYAYVYPGNPYEIYVCYYFFRAPNLGRDSAAGTLVHEMSHFNVVAGTDDYVYGEANALQLAATDPRRAIKNADNYEYFAEDH